MRFAGILFHRLVIRYSPCIIHERLLESVTGTQISDRGARSRKDADDDLDALKELWVGENLDLIRSIDDETMRRIRQALTARITGSVNHAGLAKDLIVEIQAITEKEKSRAELIARDQLGKLHGQIQSQEAGIARHR